MGAIFGRHATKEDEDDWAYVNELVKRRQEALNFMEHLMMFHPQLLQQFSRDDVLEASKQGKLVELWTHIHGKNLSECYIIDER